MVKVSSKLSKQRRFSNTYTSYISPAVIRNRSDEILRSSLSFSTQTTYDTGFKFFANFRTLYFHSPCWPPLLSHITDFIAYLSLLSYSPCTISTYISAISFKCKVSGMDDPTQRFVVRKMLSGIHRVDKRTDPRRPITPSILNRVILALPFVCFSKYESLLFASLFSTSYFGFFRVGELVQSTTSSLGHALLACNIKMLSHTDCLQIYVPHSKVDQQGKGVAINLSSNGSAICPVNNTKAFLAVRPNISGTFFCHSSGQPVTHYQFVSVLKKAFWAANIDSKCYSSHSFRIGTATSASMA